VERWLNDRRRARRRGGSMIAHLAMIQYYGLASHQAGGRGTKNALKLKKRM
jgi:hypothetical protein